MRDKKQQPKGRKLNNRKHSKGSKKKKHSEGSKELDDYIIQEDWKHRKIARNPKVAELSDEQWEVLWLAEIDKIELPKIWARNQW